MDLSAIMAGIRTIRPEETALFAAAKHSALRSSYIALGADAGFSSFEDFVDAVPASILTTYFGSDGVDQHYTRLIGGLAAGKRGFDAILAMTLNYIQQELTYQGRYIGRYEPEATVIAGGDTDLIHIASANASRIETFKIGLHEEADSLVEARMARLAQNARPLVWGSPTMISDAIRTDLGRPLGCLAILDIGLPKQATLSYDAILADLEQHCTTDTFFLFAGETRAIMHLRRQIAAQESVFLLIQRAYRLVEAGGGIVERAVLIVTQSQHPPRVALPDPVDHYTVDRDFPTHERDDVTVIEVCANEMIPVRRPWNISSSAPLDDGQIRTVTNSVPVEHRVARIDGGKVIDARSNFEQSYVIATGSNEILHSLHLDYILAGTPYGKPDAAGIVEVPAREIVRLEGSFLLFSFSPAIVAYHSHFLLQCFTRIVTAEALQVPGLRLLVPQELRGYQRRMLEMVGWGGDRLVTLQPDCAYQCDSLYVPNIPAAIFSPFQSTIYDRLIAQVDPVPVDPKKRIIISRAARTTWRNMVNYDAVCDLLVRDLGFEVVEPDKLSIEDEIRLFQSSAIVVGAEGAGMYNCCFMAPGTDVVVMADQDYVMYVVGSMAAIRDFDVSFVFGESFQADRDLVRKAGHADFVADPLRVKAAVERVIARRAAQAN